MKRIIAIAAALAAVALAGCTSAASSASPYQSMLADSAVVPCSQFSAQLTTLAKVYPVDGPGDPDPTLYGRETALASKFSRVSNADTPLNLSGAEVNFEIAALDEGLSQGEPYSRDMADGIDALAAACGINLPQITVPGS